MQSDDVGYVYVQATVQSDDVSYVYVQATVQSDDVSYLIQKAAHPAAAGVEAKLDNSTKQRSSAHQFMFRVRNHKRSDQEHSQIVLAIKHKKYTPTQ